MGLRKYLEVGYMYFTRNSKKLQDIRPTFRTYARVGILDTDYNFHMNNARYLEKFELGRTRHLYQIGFFAPMLHNGFSFVVSATDVSFFKELKPLQSFEITSTFMGEDGKYIYLNQTLEVKGKIHSQAIVKAALVQKGKVVKPIGFFEKIYQKQIEIPVLPEYIGAWKKIGEAKRLANF